MVQQSSSQQKHQQMASNPLVLNNFMAMQPQRNQSRKSNGATSATGNRRRIANESPAPDMYKISGANQTMNPVQQAQTNQRLAMENRKASPMKGVKKMVPSRPSSAQQKQAQGVNQKLGPLMHPMIPGQSASVANATVGASSHSQGLQGVQTTQQKLRLQQQFNQRKDGSKSPQNAGDESGTNADKNRTQTPVPDGAADTAPPPKKGGKNKISNVVTKFSFATKGGIAAHNPYKTNQDAYITSPHIMGLKHCHFFSVCDGHG